MEAFWMRNVEEMPLRSHEGRVHDLDEQRRTALLSGIRAAFGITGLVHYVITDRSRDFTKGGKEKSDIGRL
jgi:hypothetical protein